jgi:starvation-inducible DNA-binding protein
MNSVVKNEAKVEVAEVLKPVLADEYVMYTKLRNYHWNVTGNMFFELHELFEKLYNELADDIDEIAERIRTLGIYAPGSMSEFLELASIKEEKADSVPPQLEMVEKVVDDFEFLIISLNQAAEKIQSEYNDEVTFGQLLNLSEKYQKHSWMLKSLIQK